MSNLLQQLLDDQQDLTAVERFAQLHDGNQIPTQQKHYQHLLPASPLKSGEQLGFGVDLNRCSGCKACVTACHSLNGLDETETWRDVGVLISENEELPILQHVTTACHHCLDPACASACPVDAYEKDPVTGIVRHLDDQCFGCQYCTLACPYDVPKYHEKKGIVRKCDMCSDRLAVGEAPACVQACPHEAISIQTVNSEELVAQTTEEQLVATAPKSDFTVPTTTYKGRQKLVAGDSFNPSGVTPQHAHAPLVVMLVLSQLSVGIFTTLAVAGLFAFLFSVETPLASHVQQMAAVAGFAIGQLALAAATLHLGRPQYAFRAMVGFRHSWLSREVIVFGAFTAASGTYTGILLLPWFSSVLPALSVLQNVTPLALLPAALWATVLCGIAGVSCSAMIYVFTRRHLWSARQTFGRFLGTAVSLGPTFVGLVVWGFEDSANQTGLRVLISSGFVFAASKLWWEIRCLSHWKIGTDGQLNRSANLVETSLSSLWKLRLLSGVISVLCLVAALAMTPLFLLSAVVLGLTGEVCERVLFFKAVAPDRMPSGLSL